jgi:ligand-binding sensor domain-containing protein/signal transduction histidine kinase
MRACAVGLLAASALLLVPIAPAQRVLPDGYTRRVWQTQDGLPENTIQAFAQTPDHYLWIGTTGGLVRFDGDRFVVFDRENTPAIREDNIFCLTASRDGALWIGTDGGGLLRYSRRTFRAYSTANGLTNPFVRTVYEDNRGVVWVGTDDGLFRLSGANFVRMDGGRNNRIPAMAVHAIREDRHGNLWVGGSTLVRIAAGEVTEYPTGEDSAGRVKSILETNDGTIWVGTVSGLQRLRPDAGRSARLEKVREISSTVRALLEDRSGTLWIGSIGEGLLRFRDKRFAAVTAADVLPSGTVLSLFEDDEENIWTGLQTGLLRLSRAAMSTFPLANAANADFGTVYPDRDGSLWVASTHLYKIGPRRQRAELVDEPSKAGVRVRNVFRDRTGALWIGTEGYGVFRVKDGKRTNYTKRSGLVNDFVRVFLETRDGSIWIGTDEFISRWRAAPNSDRANGNLTNYTAADGLCYSSIRALLEDKRGDIWIGTDRGVSHYHDARFVHDAVTGRLRNQKVWTIHEDRAGALWFGTSGGGLFHWRDAILRSLDVSRGLVDNRIYQLLEDAGDTFWMSGPNGICSVSRHDLERTAQDPGFRPAVTLYGLSDGIDATLMHGGVQPAGCVTASGEIWFPGNRGPVRILPPQVRTGGLPQVVIEQILVDGRERSVSDRLAVPPGAGKLQIDYSAVRLRSQERIRFRYKLEGFDPEWTEPLRRRVAYYTNLPAGHYKFHVQAFETNMPQSVTEKSLAIEWRPHIYRTPWFSALFSALCAGLAMALGIAGYRLRMRQIQARFDAVLAERNRVAREMHDTVIQGCTAVSAVLEAVASVSPADTDLCASLLDRARQQIRSTIGEAKRAVWNLRHGGASTQIETLLEQVALQLSQSSQVPVRIYVFGPPQALDPAVTHDVLMVAREGLFNAVRHAQPNEIVVKLHFEAGSMRVEISDDGCGFDPRVFSGEAEMHFGLLGMRERIEHLGGRLDVQSALGMGTKLSIEVPLRSVK